MTSTSDKVIQLRQLLSERFGQSKRMDTEALVTGFPTLDEIGIPKASLTEIVAPPNAGPGGSLLLYGLIHSAIQKGERVVLIDGKRAFSPKGLSQPDLNRLLWTRCREAGEAIKAADLAIRDGNLPFVILLLSLNPPGELRRIPANVWQRLQMLAEKSSAAVLVFTPQAQIGCAQLRLSVGGAFPLDRLHICRDELFGDLNVRVERRRVTGRRMDEDLCRASCA